MYQAMEPVCHDLKNFAEILTGDHVQERVKRIVDAFEQTTRDVSEQMQEAKEDSQRAHFRRIYRGMIAARRLVERLHELPGAGEATPL